MRKQLIKTIEEVLNFDANSVLLLGDIGVFGFRNAFKNHPNRVFNIGILEQSTISLSAGLSKTGMIPIFHSIAPFVVERPFEQLKIDFGYQNLCGNFISIGSSYDYAALGPTHHCPGDIQILKSIPNMEIVLPGNSKEFDDLFKQSYRKNPTYYRLSEYEHEQNIKVEFGKANLIRSGRKATIICIGNLLDIVTSACTNLDVTILYYTTLSPFDNKILLDNFSGTIILIEPFYEGTMNYDVNKTLEGKMYSLYNIGIKREFLSNYGSKGQHDKNLGMETDSIRKKILQILD